MLLQGHPLFLLNSLRCVLAKGSPCCWWERLGLAKPPPSSTWLISQVTPRGAVLCCQTKTFHTDRLLKFYLFTHLFSFCFLGPHPQHIKVARLGVKSELQLPDYTTATATWDPSCICDLHHSTGQRQIPDPLSKARGQTHISWILIRFVFH